MISPSIIRLAARVPMLSAADELALVTAGKAGDVRARDAVILAHLRMAVAAAMKMRRYNVPVDDLAQEGVAALVRAFDKFDPALGFRFATFAMHTVRSAVADTVLKRSTTVRPATDMKSKRLFFIGQAERYRLERAGDLTPSEVNRRLAVRMGVSVQTVEAMQSLVHGEVGFDAPLAEGLTVGDTLADEADGQDVIVQRDFDAERRRAVIDDAMGCLDDRERVIVCARHYADEGDEVTLETLGLRFKLSKERIRQIEVKALRKLRDAMAPRRSELGLIAA